MITPNGSSVRIIGPEVNDEAVRQAVLDEAGHIRELPASEWRKFEWDSVVKFMHNYPVYVLPAAAQTPHPRRQPPPPRRQPHHGHQPYGD